jgi:hypothetical protein
MGKPVVSVSKIKYIGLNQSALENYTICKELNSNLGIGTELKKVCGKDLKI